MTGIPKPDMIDLHRRIREMAKISTDDPVTGRLSRNEMIELIIFLKNAEQKYETLIRKLKDESKT